MYIERGWHPIWIGGVTIITGYRDTNRSMVRIGSCVVIVYVASITCIRCVIIVAHMAGCTVISNNSMFACKGIVIVMDIK